MTAQLGQIVGYVEQLAELDTDERRADGPRRRRAQRFRPTTCGRASPREAALANAPQHDGECYLVPAVLGE